MASSIPKVLLKGRAEEVAINGSSTKQDAPKAAKAKQPVEGQKVVIRRLPPGMTREEFLSILGPEWLDGNGKVDWFDYGDGKVARESVSLPPPQCQHKLT